jgi:hypothetical protein
MKSSGDRSASDQRARTELLINFHEKFFGGILVAVPRTRNLGTGYSEKLLADLSFKVAPGDKPGREGTGFEPHHSVGVKPHVPCSLHPIIYEGSARASMGFYHGRRRHVWLDMVWESRRERRLDKHICLQVSRVGISLDNVGKRGV